MSTLKVAEQACTTGCGSSGVSVMQEGRRGDLRPGAERTQAVDPTSLGREERSGGLPVKTWQEMTREMTKPGMAGEATLDEILASIRKVLDKESTAGKGGDDNVFAALAPAASSAQPHAAPARNGPRPSSEPAGERSPLMDRIARVVGHNAGGPGGGAAAQSASGALEKFIESDLGDLLADAPAEALKPAAEAASSQPSAPAPGWPVATAAAAPAPAPTSLARGPVPRAEPSFAALSEPALARNDAEPIATLDSLGTLVPSRLDTGHASASVASRLPPLSGAAPSADPSAFATLRPGAPEIEPRPPFPAPPAGQLGKDRLAAASWSDMMRRADDAAASPEAAPVAPPPAGEPVVLAAMGAPRRPAATQPPASQTLPPIEPAAPRAFQAASVAAAEVAVPAPVASEPVVLAAMGPKAASAAPKPARSAVESEPVPAAPRDGLQAISHIEAAPPAAADAAGKAATAVATAPSSAGIAAAQADTNAAVASALGALAAGLAASSAKPAATAQVKPVEQASPSADMAKSEQPDLVKGLSMAAAARAEVFPVAEVLASAHVASPPAAPLPPLKTQPEIAAAAAPTGPVAQPVSDASKPSEAFLALASTQSQPASRAMLPSVIGAHGMIEPESPLDDTVAELLRPMLRQWLADNMPRIVEKALRIELAESLKNDH